MEGSICIYTSKSHPLKKIFLLASITHTQIAFSISEGRYDNSCDCIPHLWLINLMSWPNYKMKLLLFFFQMCFACWWWYHVSACSANDGSLKNDVPDWTGCLCCPKPNRLSGESKVFLYNSNVTTVKPENDTSHFDLVRSQLITPGRIMLNRPP